MQAAGRILMSLAACHGFADGVPSSLSYPDPLRRGDLAWRECLRAVPLSALNQANRPPAAAS
jgi:hypothetical protein